MKALFLGRMTNKKHNANFMLRYKSYSEDAIRRLDDI